nr:hypothetical protein [Trochiscia hystrix]
MKNNVQKWNEWFAGLTDGDGCFYINKKEKTVSFEITTHISDSRVLFDIKNKLKAGSVKLRSNSQSVRYRVKQKSVIIDILNRLNGKLYNKGRLEQFAKVCEMLNIKLIDPSPLLDKKSAYLAGLIDSDGTLAISISHSSSNDSQKSGVAGRTIRLINSKAFNQISLKITSINKQNLMILNDSYGIGEIYEEKLMKKNKSSKIKYHWVIRSYEEFLFLYEYLKRFPLKSVKMHRIRLSLLYFKYKQLKYHLKSSETIEFKIWEKFCKSWFKYSF